MRNVTYDLGLAASAKTRLHLFNHSWPALPQQEDFTVKTGTRKVRKSLFLVAGLLVLAAICSDGRYALAQVRDPCPLPPGVTLPPDPRVTAQQVVDDASLMAFALAVRDQYVESSATVNQGFHLGCLIRQAGTPWRSGLPMSCC